ncbi:SET domain-containing protein 5 [Diplodia seriata]|uniref:SET domain-containing protein 5 n=1 Tax=Diplodia seriata TaxID=420778 RepID=A0A1S8BK80_9PEZI|nr:SET domain-containing protein 5 [Diplodia seriata]
MTALPNPKTTTHPSLLLAPLPGRGIGTLATAKIARGTRLVTEEPLLAATLGQTLNVELFAHSLVGAYAALSDDGRRRVAALAAHPEAVKEWIEFFKIEAAVAVAEASAWGSGAGGFATTTTTTTFGTEASTATAAAPSSSSSSSLSVEERAHLMAAWTTNCFGINKDESAAGWAGVIAPRAARFNHSCVPNAMFAWNDTVSAITVQTIKDVEEGEEVTVAYTDTTRAGRKRRESLKKLYGFDCDCSACSGEEVMLDDLRWRIRKFKEELAGPTGKIDGERAVKMVEEGVKLHEQADLIGSHLANL